MQPTGSSCSNPCKTGESDRRRIWMAVLALSSPGEVEKALEKIAPPPVFSRLRGPEFGLVMIQGRAGGTGRTFNLGEMTVTRCTVQTEGGYTGSAYVAGRSAGHAEAAALLDALLQDPQRRDFVMGEIVVPLEKGLRGKREQEAEKADSTRVEFFTLVRGD